jgi:tRNA pseudouridine38-40 synthase
MARYQIILAYDGSDLLGSQRQAKGRTAQGELENALRCLGWQGNSVILAGRTDTGVHASGQVAACDLDWKHSETELLEALNSHLPRDMAASRVKIVPDTFHPRFDATSRTYRYHLFCQALRNPLRERYAWRVWPGVNGEALRSAAQLLIGRYDFAAFGTPPRTGSSTVRTVMCAKWSEEENGWTFTVQADAFLYRMVRRMVFVQVAVGLGKTPAEHIAAALADSRSGASLPAGLAPAHGLTLVQVTYHEELV